MYKVKLIATDLDGTFLKNDHSISNKNLNTLRLLGEKNITRVIATGRNLKKVKDVIPSPIPFDYIIFSSGAGIYNCQTQQHIFNQNIPTETSGKLISSLKQMGVSFNAFFPIPENHKFLYYSGLNPVPEFETYYRRHNSHADPLQEANEISFSQFLVILPNDEPLFHKLKKVLLEEFDDIGIIRTTSPLMSGNIWMEIFHKSISKGDAVAWLCNLVGIDREHTLGIGNDYNDIELLNYTNYSYLASNAPESLKTQYSFAPSNEEDAFSYAVQQTLKQ